MDREAKVSGRIYPTEDSNEASNGCSSDNSDSDAQQLLESLSQGQRASRSCTRSHPLCSQDRRRGQFSCPPKKSIIRLICNMMVLIAIMPFCLLKKIYCTLVSRSFAGKMVFWVTLFALLFGVIYVRLFDGDIFQLDEWRECAICDLILGETKDLRSLMKANRILERKVLQLAVVKEEMMEELNKLQSQLHGLQLGLKAISYQAVSKALEGYTSKGITKWSAEKIINQLLKKLDEDDVQMPDYALQSAGASIVHSRTTRSYRHDGGNYFWMSILVFPFVKSADIILQPMSQPGECWAFPGHQGETVVRLAMEVIPRAVTIQHISKQVSPTGEISSAPKDFSIYGLKEEDEEQGTFLGQYAYDADGDLIQTFQLKNEFSEYMSHVQLKVLSNWGHPNFTCIYRFRVHGDQYVL